MSDGSRYGPSPPRRGRSYRLRRRFGDAADDSKGIFPPETGFAEWMIPALREAGIEWVMVDNIHFDRARSDYPYTAASNLVPPNPAEQRNTTGDVNWVQLNNIWAPSQVSAPWGYQPHRVEYVDPATGRFTFRAPKGWLVGTTTVPRGYSLPPACKGPWER